MFNLRPVFMVVGSMLAILSFTLLIPTFFDLYDGSKNYISFVIASFISAFFGISLLLLNKVDEPEKLNIKQVFLLTTLSWLSLVLFASIPFMFSDLKLSFVDAFFESMSGLTTTGATILTGLDDMSRGILIWRALLQWLGGIGIIVMAMAVLPMLKIGGMQLFRSESSDDADKVLPKTAQITTSILGIYLFFTVTCAFCLLFAGMESFDALAHAMTTVATAGFSTHDASVAYFNNTNVEIIMMVFMILSGIPYVRYIQATSGSYKPILRDKQVHWFLSGIFIAVTAVTLWLYYKLNFPFQEALRNASFNVVSILTTTGYTSANYNLWGVFVIELVFVLCVIGGCTGSTTGGIKIFRFQVLYNTAKTQIHQLIQPHGVFKTTLNNRTIDESVISSVMSFFILFCICFVVLGLGLSATGLDFITSMSGAASMLANLGPALGDVIGPAGNYSTLPDAAKWLLSFGMLIGRLEIFTVLVLFSYYFWKR